MAKKNWFTPERIKAVVMPLISILLAGFLILLAGKVIDDLGGWVSAPNREVFFNQAAIATKLGEIASVDRERAARSQEIDDYAKAADIAQRNYRAEKQSFDNWLAARRTIGSPNEDPMVLDKAKELDKVRAVESAWRARIDTVQVAVRALDARTSALQEQRGRLEHDAQKQFAVAERAYELKIFLIRLAITLPFLILAVVAFMRWRKSTYAPLVWGYILFGVYVFFVGLVPYLPSYGGYVRYVVGIVMTVGGGIYAIKYLTAYAQRKSLEIQESTTSRAKKISYELAIASYRQHSCPSCEKDYLTAVPADATPAEKNPKFCFHCGLHLFGGCTQCGAINFLHFPFCRTCGTGLKKDATLIG
ncbi:MAG: hypothetical protein H7315_15545 [Herminiimonas sp.]|nr:hypothetical protein [Herminiimonas sp.]